MNNQTKVQQTHPTAAVPFSGTGPATMTPYSSRRSIHDHLSRRRSSVRTRKSRQVKSIGLSVLWLGIVNFIMLFSFHPAKDQYHVHRSLSSFRESRRRLRNLKNDDAVVVDLQSDAALGDRNNELRCTDYGGPHTEYYTDLMMYWDPNNETPPVTTSMLDEERYLTFESDRSGFNSVRLVWETVTALAWATNRTLVIPPRQAMSKLRKEYDGSWRRQATTFSYMDLFELEGDSAQLPMITMEEFLERMSNEDASHDKDATILRDLTTGGIVPPISRFDWDDEEQQQELEEYLRRIGHSVTRLPRKIKKYTQATGAEVAITSASSWNPQECVVLFGDDTMSTNETLASFTKVLYDEDQLHVNKDSSLPHRFQEIYAGRTRLCTYDNERRNQHVLHLSRDHRNNRLTVPFYAFILSQYGHQDVLLRQYIRNHVRYADELQCAAARIVEHLQDVVSDVGTFYAVHLRGGSFAGQYQSANMDADAILSQTQPEIPLGSTIYFAATDLAQHDEDLHDAFLTPFREVHARVITLQDLLLEPSLGLQDLNSNLLGMVEQLVCAKAEAFFGHWFSTYSAYITRLRGYHYRRHHQTTAGAERSYYYAPADKKYVLQETNVVHKPFHSREFSMGWRME